LQREIEMTRDTTGSVEPLLAIMRALRDPVHGCPWDIEQSFSSISAYTLEEAYEVCDAISRGSVPDLKDELGDLLLQVVFHAQIASDQGLFGFRDVVLAICDKMIRRHPHVFGATTDRSDRARARSWEDDKARERSAKGSQSALDGVAAALPALTRADKLATRAARVGFDWDNSDRVWAKVDEEIGELKEAIASGSADKIEDEMGDVLFVLANLARHLKADPEAALRRTNAKFERRFRAIEAMLTSQGRTIQSASLEEMEELWVAVKLEERRGSGAQAVSV
jgi:nucleoside triphosphate diphosphatase